MSYFWAFLEYGVVIGMIVFLLFHRIGIFAATPREEIDDLTEQEQLRDTVDPIVAAESEMDAQNKGAANLDEEMDKVGSLAGSSDADTVAALLQQVGVNPPASKSLRK